MMQWLKPKRKLRRPVPSHWKAQNHINPNFLMMMAPISSHGLLAATFMPSWISRHLMAPMDLQIPPITYG